MKIILKKIILTLLFIFCINHFTYSQKIELSQEKLNKVLCKTWVLNFTIEKGKVFNDVEDFKKEVMKFELNKTYTIKAAEGNITDKWQYNKNGKYIVLFTNGKVTCKIKSIDDKSLIMVPIVEGTTYQFMKDFELHFKPVK